MIVRKLFILANLLLFSTGVAFAQINCEEKKASTLATANSLPNLREAKGSLNFESKQMLKTAEAQRKKEKPSVGACPSECKLFDSPKIVFYSEPNVFLKDYSDKTKCLAYLEKTIKEPIKFSKQTFSSMDEFASWFADFSQGKGEKGRQLYKLCDGQCSPKYRTIIQYVNGQIVAEPEVICAEARDKSENNYLVSYGFLWSCGNDGK